MDSESGSVPSVIRYENRESTNRKLNASAPSKTKSNALISGFAGGDMDPFQSSRSNNSRKSTLSRKRQWNWFKFIFPKAFNDVTPGGSKKVVQRPSGLRSSFQSQTENTEDVSSEFFVTTPEISTETEPPSLLPETLKTTKLITKSADESKTSARPWKRSVHHAQSGKTKTLNERIVKQAHDKPTESKATNIFMEEKGKLNEFKQPLHLSLSQMDKTDGFPILKQASDFEPIQTKLIGTEKWELSIPTIVEDRSAEFLSTKLERRSPLFLKGQELEAEPKRVERRNAIIMQSEKSKQVKPKRLERRKENKKPKSNKMERRNAIVIHCDAWEFNKAKSNKMPRRNAIMIHDDELIHLNTSERKRKEEMIARNKKVKRVQSKSNRKKRKSGRSKSIKTHGSTSIIFQNQARNRQLVKHRCKFSIDGGLLLVLGLLVTILLAALPMIIDDWFIINLDLTFF